MSGFVAAVVVLSTSGSRFKIVSAMEKSGEMMSAIYSQNGI